MFSWEGVRLIDPYEYTVQWWKYARVRIESSPLDPLEVSYWTARAKRRKRGSDLHPLELDIGGRGDT